MGRRLKLGANSAVLTIGVIALVVCAYYLSVRHPLKKDMTAAKSNTLSREMTDMLAKLDKPVNILVFFPEEAAYSEPRKKIDDLMHEVARNSKMVTYRMVDPNRDPVLTNNAGMNDIGIHFESGGRIKKLYMEELFGAQNPYTGEGGEFKGEQAIFNGIFSVAMERNYFACFTSGHGERALREEQTLDGLGVAAKALEDQSYAVDEVNIIEKHGVPERCTVLIAAGPEKPFSADEISAVEKFLERGGGFMAMLDPFNETGLKKLTKGYGIDVPRGVVNDPSASFGRTPYELMPLYSPGPVTDKLIEKKLTLNLLLTRPLTISSPGGATATPVLETTDNAWVDTTGAGSRGETGKVVVAALAERSRGAVNSRLLVVGDSDFATNKSLASIVSQQQGTTVIQQGGTGNADFLLNSVNWLSGEEKYMTIRPKPLDLKPLNITAAAHRTVFMVFTFFVPFFVLALGGLVWHWRRSL